MGMMAWIYCEYRYENGPTWTKRAEFEIGSARRFHGALEKSGLGGHGLPNDTGSSIQNVYEELQPATAQAEGIFSATWIAAEELPSLQNAQYWLNERELSFVPPHAYEGYAENDTLQAREAFAQAHLANGNPVRFVCWFA